ncbi:MAG: hypothetical protein GY866_39370 [Proteobacteria bacterium]|nr:hypothetical protein [Pseudomonadota bacterium]
MILKVEKDVVKNDILKMLVDSPDQFSVFEDNDDYQKAVLEGIKNIERLRKTYALSYEDTTEQDS